jgi:hypothetical protein
MISNEHPIESGLSTFLGVFDTGARLSPNLAMEDPHFTDCPLLKTVLWDYPDMFDYGSYPH